MNSPTTRVLNLLELLQAHGPLSGPDLARRLGIEGRSLRRYIGKLEALGIPVLAERGRYGGYRLMPGFKLPPMMFSDDEAVALSVGLLAARGLGLPQAVETAQGKLERVMPTALRQRAQALRETVTLDLPGSASLDNGQWLMTFSLAAHQHQQVHLRYRSALGQDSERDIDPYGLACRGGRWYVVGYCHQRRGLRSFRLDRVRAVEATAGRFHPPTDFDAVQHLALRLASLPRAWQVRVLLKADMATARRCLSDSLGLFQPLDGGVLLHSQVDDLDWFARELARLPFDVVIHEPAALRDAVRAQGERLIRLAAADGGLLKAGRV